MEEATKNLRYAQVLEQETQGWRKFRRALRKEDQVIFEQLFEKARLYVDAGENVIRPWPFEIILISILMEQEKALNELGSRLKACDGK